MWFHHYYHLGLKNLIMVHFWEAPFVYYFNFKLTYQWFPETLVSSKRIYCIFQMARKMNLCFEFRTCEEAERMRCLKEVEQLATAIWKNWKDL